MKDPLVYYFIKELEQKFYMTLLLFRKIGAEIQVKFFDG